MGGLFLLTREVDVAAATNATKPSHYYESARTTLTIRLSELIFGSLVASYILGFIGTFDIANLPALVASLPCLAISITFSYLTAAFYLHYHCSLLTMPTMALKRAGIDFTFALSQGILFGFSITRPAFFPACISIAILAGFLRQHFERIRLVAFLADLTWPTNDAEENDARDHEDRKKRRRKKVSREVPSGPASGGQQPLLGWAPVSAASWIGVAILLAIGVTYAVEEVGKSIGRPLPLLDQMVPIWTTQKDVTIELPMRDIVTAVGAWVVCCFVGWNALGILHRGGEIDVYPI